jgi:hypothetical protein
MMISFHTEPVARQARFVASATDKAGFGIDASVGRQVAETEQLTVEQAAARRRMLAAAHVPLEDPAKTPAAE